MAEIFPKRRVAILGSTGSIGTQALDVITRHRDRFEVELLTANTSSDLLIKQAAEIRPNCVVICDESRYDEVFSALDPLDIKVYTGIESICSLVQSDNINMVLSALVGFSGLKPAIAAIEAGKALAIANKETLVAAGHIVTARAHKSGAAILPVDSEHSAIFQCLQGERTAVEKILLTGSGGPFLHSSREEIYSATVEQALNHPRWKMGAKVTIDSASLMNKGLELIEARWLFDVQPSNIEVVIHPQSIIHSMVQFADGAIKAQLSDPDMRIPIAYALSYPYRVDLPTSRTDFAALASMTFEKPDTDRFPCLKIACDAITRGGNAPCAMNAANESAVAAFLQGIIRFGQIPEVISEAMAATDFIADASLDDIYKTNDFAAAKASEIIQQIKR